MLVGSIAAAPASTPGYYYLEGVVSGTTVTLYSTYGQGGSSTGQGTLYSVTDTEGYVTTTGSFGSAMVNTLAAVGNSSLELFRGVASVPTLAVAGPIVTDAQISISGATGIGGAYKIGDTITATWNNTASGDNNAGITGVTVNFTQFGGGAAVVATNNAQTWTATYTIVAGSIDLTNRNVSVTATNGTATTTSDSTNATVDNIRPTVTINQASGQSDPTSSSPINFTAVFSEAVTGFDASNDLSLSGTAGATTSVISGGTSTYNVAVSGMTGSGTVIATIAAGGFNNTVIDDVGNTSVVSTSTDNTVTYNAPVVPPTVTDANISISGATGTGGAFKIGDTVTATWNNTAGGDNNAGITGVTVNFSQFGGGAAVAATNNNGIWTATYTIVAGSIDLTNRNVSVTASNGNSTTTSDSTNATVDNIAPTVTDPFISISGGTGTGGAFKIGDTATATWNNTAGGQNNSDTISAVTVDFTQFGGGAAVSATNSSGTWTATYAIVAGSINGVANRNVLVTVTDNAGNPATAADTTNATVDNVAPTIASANFVDNVSGGPVNVNTAITYTLTFSEDIINSGGGALTAADISNVNSLAATIGTITETSPGVFTVVVTPTAAGSLILRLPAGAVVTDAIGNPVAVPVQDNTTITVSSPGFNVSGTPTVTGSGVVVNFNDSFPTSQLNLIARDETGATVGTADVTLVGNTVGAVRGSLVVGPGNQVTFVKTGGLLAADTYTLTLRSATDGFVSSSSQLLNGGSNYTYQFTVASNSAAVLSLPDFARGAGQVDASGNTYNAGLPLTLSNGSGLLSVDAEIVYDPTIISLTGATSSTGWLAAFNAHYATLPNGLEVAKIGLAGASALAAARWNWPASSTRCRPRPRTGTRKSSTCRTSSSTAGPSPCRRMTPSTSPPTSATSMARGPSPRSMPRRR